MARDEEEEVEGYEEDDDEPLEKRHRDPPTVRILISLIYLQSRSMK